jgi:hypothetical protein
MAQQITSSLPWKKLPTKILVNAETGQSEVFMVGGGLFGQDVKVAEVGANNAWVVTDPLALSQRYNSANGTKLTSVQVQDTFLLDGTKVFNNERAAIINKNSPYNTKTFLSTKQDPVPGVVNPATGTKPGQTSQTTAPAPPGPGPNSDPNVGTATTSTTSTSTPAQINTNIGSRKNLYPKKNLYYPVKRKNEFGGDFIKFEILDYKKSGLGSPQAVAAGSLALPGMEYRKRDVLASIFLPIQAGIVEGMSVDWGGGDLNPITAAFANAAYQIMGQAGADPGAMFSATLNQAESLKKMLQIGAGGELQQLAQNYFTEKAVSTQGLLSRTLGGAINNNLELLFNGPMLRSFTFNFKLTPREPAEALMIRDIIRYFKMSMAPSLSSAQLFLLAPNVFKISYVYTGQGNLDDKHPYLNRIKVAALRDISVNYTPDGNYMTYQDGSMTQYDLSLSFGEIDPIYENDYVIEEGLVGTGW